MPAECVASRRECAPLTAAVLSARGIENQPQHGRFQLCAQRSARPVRHARHGPAVGCHSRRDRARRAHRGLRRLRRRRHHRHLTLVDYLRTAGAACEYYIPNRLSEGYGLTRQAMEELYRRGTRLMITVDSASPQTREIALARELGMKVVITDHHECHDELPEAEAVIDCKQAGDTYPFDSLAGVGVAFKRSARSTATRTRCSTATPTLSLSARSRTSCPSWAKTAFFVAEGLQRMEKDAQHRPAAPARGRPAWRSAI